MILTSHNVDDICLRASTNKTKINDENRQIICLNKGMNEVKTSFIERVLENDEYSKPGIERLSPLGERFGFERDCVWFQQKPIY